MSRLTITTTVLAAAALALPGAAFASPVEAAAHLEAHAVVDSGSALDQVHGSAAKAKRMLQRSELALKRAYAISVAQGHESSAKGIDAAAKFSASAQAQGENLSAIVEKSRGSLKTAAADTLAKTGRMDAALTARVAKQLEAQQTSASTEQGQDVAAVGGNQADLTATIALTASGQGLHDAAQEQLDKATQASVKAQARLVKAVSDLRDRTEENGQGSMSSAQVSLQHGLAGVADALRRSGRWDVSFEKTAGTSGGPVSATMTVQARAVVDGGSR
jgi:hypothetical protein